MSALRYANTLLYCARMRQRFTLQSISYALFMLCISIADYALSAVINVVIVRTIKIACNSEGKLHAQGQESHTEQR